MESEPTGDGATTDADTDVMAVDNPIDTITGPDETNTEKLEVKVSGDNSTGNGSFVLGLPKDRIVGEVKCEGHRVDVHQWTPGGRTDIDETEIVVEDLYDGDAAVVILEVSNG